MDALIACRAYMESEARQLGGQIVAAQCGSCGAVQYGRVTVRVEAYVRSCNCDEPREATEARIIAAARAKAA